MAWPQVKYSTASYNWTELLGEVSVKSAAGFLETLEPTGTHMDIGLYNSIVGVTLMTSSPNFFLFFWTITHLKLWISDFWVSLASLNWICFRKNLYSSLICYICWAFGPGCAVVYLEVTWNRLKEQRFPGRNIFVDITNEYYCHTLGPLHVLDYFSIGGPRNNVIVTHCHPLSSCDLRILLRIIQDA